MENSEIEIISFHSKNEVEIITHCLPVTPWTVALQASLSIVFSRQECWSELPFPPPEDLPSPGIGPVSPMSPAMAGRSFTTKPPPYCNEYPWPCIFECMCGYVYRKKKRNLCSGTRYWPFGQKDLQRGYAKFCVYYLCVNISFP